MTDPEFEALLDAAIVGDRERRPVVLVEYDDRWPGVFEEHRARIADALGSAAQAIEHVGSTAVPDLAAKPIIDICLVVRDLEDEPAYRPALESAGYPIRVVEPGHRMFRTPERDVHLHVYAKGDPEVDRVVRFRDRLRADPQDRALYERTKRDLARRDWPDMNYYARAKSSVIEEILTRAQAGSTAQ